MSVDSHTNASFASPVSMWEDRRLLPYAGNHVIVELKGSRFLCGLFRIVYGEVGHILTSTREFYFMCKDVIAMTRVILEDLFTLDNNFIAVSSMISSAINSSYPKDTVWCDSLDNLRLPPTHKLTFLTPLMSGNSWWDAKIQSGRVLTWIDLPHGHPCFIVRLDEEEKSKAIKFGTAFQKILNKYMGHVCKRPYAGNFIEMGKYYVLTPKRDMFEYPFEFTHTTISPTIPINITQAALNPFYNSTKIQEPKVQIVSRKRKTQLMGHWLSKKYYKGPAEIPYVYSTPTSNCDTAFIPEQECYFSTDFYPPTLPPNTHIPLVEVLFDGIPNHFPAELIHSSKFFRIHLPQLAPGDYSVTVHHADTTYKTSSGPLKVAQLPATFFKEIDTSTSTSSSSSSNSEEDDEQCDFGDIDNSHGGHYTDRIDNTLDPYIFMAHIMDPYYLAYMGGTIALEYYLKVSNYAALNAQDAFGGTFLFWAAVAGQLDTVEMLLKVGANPRISAFSGETALHIASENSNLELVRSLLKSGADPNALTRGTNETPLHYANGEPAVIQILSQYGADPFILNAKGQRYDDDDNDKDNDTSHTGK